MALLFFHKIVPPFINSQLLECYENKQLAIRNNVNTHFHGGNHIRECIYISYAWVFWGRMDNNSKRNQNRCSQKRIAHPLCADYSVSNVNLNSVWSCVIPFLTVSTRTGRPSGNITRTPREFLGSRSIGSGQCIVVTISQTKLTKVVTITRRI